MAMKHLTVDQMGVLTPIVASVSHRLARKYRAYLEACDIQQELWIWMMARDKRWRPLVECDPEDRDALRRETAFLDRNLYRRGDVICRAEKARVSGYRHSDEFFYSSGLIIALLQAEANGGKMVAEQTTDKVRRTRSLAEGNEMEAMLSDLRAALATLSPEQRSLLDQRFVEERTQQAVADDLGVSRQAAEQRINRIMDKLIDSLGGPSPYR
jgi:RNA polymerase sigma factor (sigma-70 family)